LLKPFAKGLLLGNALLFPIILFVAIMAIGSVPHDHYQAAFINYLSLASLFYGVQVLGIEFGVLILST
jgi:hypothetical protein